MKFQILALLAAAGTTTAKYTSNLNYRSPSEHHPFLGISIFKVVRRNNPHGPKFVPAANINFTHGVASGDPYAHSVILWTRAATMYADNDSNGKSFKCMAIFVA